MIHSISGLPTTFVVGFLGAHGDTAVQDHRRLSLSDLDYLHVTARAVHLGVSQRARPVGWSIATQCVHSVVQWRAVEQKQKTARVVASAIVHAYMCAITSRTA